MGDLIPIQESGMAVKIKDLIAKLQEQQGQ